MLYSIAKSEFATSLQVRNDLSSSSCTNRIRTVGFSSNRLKASAIERHCKTFMVRQPP